MASIKKNAKVVYPGLEASSLITERTLSYGSIDELSPLELERLLATTQEITYKSQTIHIHSKNWRHSTYLKCQVLACFLNMFLMGMDGQTIGSLIPTLSEYYQQHDFNISFVFILQFLGYTSSALFMDKIHRRIGRRGVLSLGSFLVCLTSGINATKPPFIVFVGAYLCSGVGGGLMDGCMNVFISSLVDHNELMGILHGSFGIGGIVVPIMISYLLKWFDGDFKVHYLTMCGLNLFSCVFSLMSFKNETSVKYEYEVSLEANDECHEETSLSVILKNKTVLIFSLFLFLYTGSETSISSWLVSYLIKVKHLNQLSSSYAISWFWIGITVGRVTLGFMTSRLFLNEYRANVFYTAMALMVYSSYTTFTLMITSYQISAFSELTDTLMFVEGLFMGPLFPTSTVALMKLLPVNLRVGSMGVVATLSGSGSALFPFFIGTITHLTKLDYLPIYICFLTAGYLVIWLSIPKSCSFS
ncbi:hypothetical protein WICANDRAFT_78570 [Wickerhamomyces anomalus NRRL Y-366-8]|uniref:Major facilitator superfamily (MFS) profile domain-containing protein n=1 Tax=Wickerhamomyces anomalus (strain ATCC 58044 / CBS 1984 / NCYC 433 / NRRL Y-366-8) TaxID=683960 RepID=A0A1E3P419_WICAA|nr:uncharacterized protein WICANDRAFT_78570 [Wickerhamomyces anomalus NRRL Y-366-8]ODQ59944.1 hypothetical protein WICANDRAFT_78570 [Wickerhamomyces anomalus NRRL Y-366-8]